MITSSFDDKSQPIFNPWDAYKRIEAFPEVVLVTFTKKVIELVKDRFETRVAGYIDGEEGLPVYTFDYEGKTFGIYRVTMGAAGVVALQEEVRILGASRFVYFGTCGTLNADIPAGHLIVPTEAYRDEGTSYHYAPADNDYIDVRTADVTARIINELGFKAFKGRVWTTDALYMETRNKMESRVKEGCICVDMECSAIHACANFRNMEAYQFLFAEDNLDASVWDRRITGRIPKDILEFAFDTALEIAMRI